MDIKPVEEKDSGGLYSSKNKKYYRFIMAALSGIPWIGSFIAASAALQAEKEQEKTNDLQRSWLNEHQDKIEELESTLQDIMITIEESGEYAQDRLVSDNYLKIVRKGFGVWDRSETQDKRHMIKRLLTRAGASKLCPDDLVRLFINWIDYYHEAHFSVIKEIYKEPGINRFKIWSNIYGETPAETSSEADLYKLLIRDLSTGSVIRQHRPVNAYGEFVKKTTKRSTRSTTLKSAFDDIEPYELTELGKKFVHYVLDDVVKKVET